MLGSIGRSVKGASQHVLNANFFFFNIILPLGVLSFYLVFSLWLFPAGVNKAFVTGFAKYLIPGVVFLYIAFFGAIVAGRIKPQFVSVRGTSLSARDLTLLLFPLTPVAQYILNNGDILSGVEAVLVFCFFAMLLSVPVIFVPFLFRRTDAFQPVMSLGMAFAFSITNMATMSGQFSWHEAGRLKIQLAVFCSVWLVSWLLFQLNLRNTLYLLIAVSFSTNLIFQLFVQDGAQSVPEAAETENMLVALTDSRKPVITPNIYLLVYDSYVASETMAGYGIDNRLQEQYLTDLGFKMYPNTYSVGCTTLTSMSRVLNSSTSFYGNFWRGASGDGVVQNLLDGLGYETYGVFSSDFFFRGNVPGYDHSFPNHGSSVSLLIEAIFVGEFRFDLDFDEVSRDEFIQEKDGVFSKVSESPKFIYAHSNLPGHSQTSGVCLPNETELYVERLASANSEMRHDIELILLNDPNAMVIVAGDHGPHLTKNCAVMEGVYEISEVSRLDIQDRFGVFLAIRWPSSVFEEYDEITVLQDIFPAIFAYIYADTSLLESKIEPVILDIEMISGATVINGVIEGGIDHGESLFTGMDER